MRAQLGSWIRRRPQLIALLVPLLVLAALLALHSSNAHPNLSKQAVIDAALKGYQSGKFSRVEAKLMHRRDLQLVLGQTSDDSDELIWVVAVAGNYGISPSFGCCSVPSDYHGVNTWGIAIFVDAPGPPHANEFATDYHGNWPPFFDGLPDLAAGS
jgi:hypothetical protein